MAVLLKGTTFSSGQSVDHTDMNNIIDTATLNPSESTGIIGSQTAEAAIDGGISYLFKTLAGRTFSAKLQSPTSSAHPVKSRLLVWIRAKGRAESSAARPKRLPLPAMISFSFRT